MNKSYYKKTYEWNVAIYKNKNNENIRRMILNAGRKYSAKQVLLSAENKVQIFLN